MTHGGRIWERGEPPSLPDFSVNLNPMGTPRFIEELIEEAIRKKVYRLYPDDYSSLRALIGELYGVDPQWIGVFNGSTEAIRLIPSSFVPEPNFGEYPRQASYCSIENGNDFIYVLRGERVVTSNPVNPTGSTITTDEIIRFLESGGTLFLDQSFTDISPVGSAVNLLEDYPNLLVLGSFTKSLSVPGLRIGYTLGKGARALESGAPPWRINSIAYYVFTHVHPKELRHFLEESRLVVSEILSSIKGRDFDNLRVYDSHAPFLLIETSLDSKVIKEELLKEGIMVRSTEDFKCLRKGHLRIALNHTTIKVLDMVSRILEERSS